MNIDRNNLEENPFEEFKPDFIEEPPLEEQEDKPKSNRTFWLLAGVIASVLVLAVIVVIIFVVMNRNRADEYTQQAAQINAQNTAIAQQATDIYVQEVSRLTEKAMMPPTWTPTVMVIIATSTPEPTATSAIQAAGDSAARTATVAAFLTAVAQGSPTVAPVTTIGNPVPTSTALPDTGFMDEVGLPGMFGVALALVLVVLIVRRLRLSASG